jgi:hypothetical protein
MAAREQTSDEEAIRSLIGAPFKGINKKRTICSRGLLRNAERFRDQH